MQTRILGRTGLTVSEIGVGGAQFGIPNYMGTWEPFSAEAQAATTATIHRALELGYTYFDTAPGYGNGRSEEMIGQALRGHRDQAILASKVSEGLWTPEGITESVENSLHRLQTDVIDIIQFHGGHNWYNAHELDLILHQGGLETMLRLKEQGKVRFIGFTAEGPSGGVEQLIACGAFDTMQIRYSLLFQHPSDFENNNGVIRQADEQSMGIILMRPLTSGVFQRLMKQTFPEIDVLDVGKLLLNYVLSDPYVDVALVGMRKTRFVEINNAISDDVASRLDLAYVHDRFAK